MNKPVVYCSGFVGQLRNMTAPLTTTQTARYVMDNQEIPKHLQYPSSTDIDDLWKTWITKNVEKTTFAYVVKVVTEALLHFGDTDVMSWINMQLESKEASPQHEQWLQETLGFVLSGYRRHTNYNAWCYVLSAGGNTHSFNVLSEKTRKMLGDKVVYGVERLTMREFVVMWIRREGGFNDLIESLHVLYGRR